MGRRALSRPARPHPHSRRQMLFRRPAGRPRRRLYRSRQVAHRKRRRRDLPRLLRPCGRPFHPVRRDGGRRLAARQLLQLHPDRPARHRQLPHLRADTRLRARLPRSARRPAAAQGGHSGPEALQQRAVLQGLRGPAHRRPRDLDARPASGHRQRPRGRPHRPLHIRQRPRSGAAPSTSSSPWCPRNTRRRRSSAG